MNTILIRKSDKENLYKHLLQNPNQENMAIVKFCIDILLIIFLESRKNSPKLKRETNTNVIYT